MKLLKLNLLLPQMQLNCDDILRKELEKFSLWSSFNGISMCNLSNSWSLYWLRFTMPKLDWRIDMKLCLDTWKLYFLWTVDGHTYVGSTTTIILEFSNLSVLCGLYYV